MVETQSNVPTASQWPGDEEGGEDTDEFYQQKYVEERPINWVVEEPDQDDSTNRVDYLEYSLNEDQEEEQDKISKDSDTPRYKAIKHLEIGQPSQSANKMKIDAEWTSHVIACDPESPERSTFTLSWTPIPSNHDFENLNSLRRNFCKQIFPKNVGLTLTEDLLLEMLMKNSYGELEMLLPGNQIYPGFLKSRITDTDIPIIVNVLLEIRGIAKLNLCYNEITDEGMELLAPAIQECGNLTELNLMHNNLTGTGILSLCKALLHRAPLHSLKLTGMKIGQEELSWYALTCLVLSGRTPLDIDIGECDLTCDGWQSFCTALHAMDNDIDYPNYLLLKDNLPIDLVSLKEYKNAYNEEIKHVTELNRKYSQPTFVNMKCPVDNLADLVNTCPAEVENGDKVSLPEVFEAFSATILQGLFDLRHRFSEEDVSKTPGLYLDPYYQKTVDEDNVLPSVSKIIENFHKSREGDWVPEYKSTNLEAQFMSPSLYRLDVIDEEIMDPIVGFTDDDDDDGQIPDDNAHAVDIYTAQAASTFVVRDAVYKAAKDSTKSEYMERSDVTQLLLLTVLETIDTIGKSQNITQDDCDLILEDAMEKVHRLIFPRMPSDCKISRDDISCFFKVIFSVAQGTFIQLFENPFVSQALVENASIACTEIQNVNGKNNLTSQQRVNEEQIRQISISFLHGVLMEAAQIIGVASPFYDAQEDVDGDLVSTELKIEDQVNSVIETSGSLATRTKDKAHEVEDMAKEFTIAADKFVVDLFEHVNNVVVHSEMKCKPIETEDTTGSTSLNEFVSRPTRLVLNRPLFPSPHEVTMAAKLGEYIGGNTTVKALHIQKWNLGEDGMEAFMESCIRNTTLVVLDLANNQLAADGMKLLAAYISQNKNLKHLTLHHNRIKDAGMAHLNLCLSDCGLVTLDISFNDITNIELDPLLTQLPSTQIRALYMWGNKFGHDTWNILKTLYDDKILSSNYTDIVLQKIDGNKTVVKNMQVRDINEYYQVPAILDEGLRIHPVYLLENKI